MRLRVREWESNERGRFQNRTHRWNVTHKTIKTLQTQHVLAFLYTKYSAQYLHLRIKRLATLAWHSPTHPPYKCRQTTETSCKVDNHHSLGTLPPSTHIKTTTVCAQQCTTHVWNHLAKAKENVCERKYFAEISRPWPACSRFPPKLFHSPCEPARKLANGDVCASNFVVCCAGVPRVQMLTRWHFRPATPPSFVASLRVKCVCVHANVFSRAFVSCTWYATTPVIV